MHHAFHPTNSPYDYIFCAFHIIFPSTSAPAVYVEKRVTDFRLLLLPACCCCCLCTLYTRFIHCTRECMLVAGWLAGYMLCLCVFHFLLLHCTRLEWEMIFCCSRERTRAGWMVERVCGVVCSIFTILMVGPVTSATRTRSRECDITYFVWPIILDVNGLSRCKDVCDVLSAIQFFIIISSCVYISFLHRVYFLIQIVCKVCCSVCICKQLSMQIDDRFEFVFFKIQLEEQYCHQVFDYIFTQRKVKNFQRFILNFSESA